MRKDETIRAQNFSEPRLPWRRLWIFLGIGVVGAGSVLGCGGGKKPPAVAINGADEAPKGHGGTSNSSPKETLEPPGVGSQPWFTDQTASSGLDFEHFNGMTGELLLSEITCGGGALLDFDGDGDLDAFLLQGQLVGEGKTMAQASMPTSYPLPLTHRLYRNDSSSGPGSSIDIRFTDVSQHLGLEPAAYGCGVAVGDYDGDGWVDLYLTHLGQNQLLRNRGGAFEDVTERAGVGDSGSSVTATFFDYDNDGWLDLFVGNNVTFDNSGATACYSLTGAPDYCGPGAYPAEADRLFHNRGDGTFEDVTAVSGLGRAKAAPTLGVVSADFNGDSQPDLYVANDGQPNSLWINEGGGIFLDRALLAGSAVNGSGASEASMGVAAADFDGDGDEDIFLSHLVKETNTLYRNDGEGFFDDHTQAARLAAPSLPFTSFGAGWLDVDNDGWLDLLVVSGAVTRLPALVQAKDPFPLHQRNQLFRSLGGEGGGVRFEDATARGGTAFEASQVSRGAAFGDVDNDGDTDVLVINNGSSAQLLVNQVGHTASWLGLRLVWGDPHRDAVGARAAVTRQDGQVMWRRVQTDGSFSSASDPRLLFGFAGAPPEESTATVTVLWPDGRREEFADLPMGRYSVLVQGQGESG
ncbi:MAG: CRTAC1 family protein [Deltaproteobacteria bacterium]|nr:CRTAC1 family protein [Deltaproteobacteria bacterium]